MKLFVSLFFIMLAGVAVYAFTTQASNRNKTTKSKKINRNVIAITVTVVIILLGFLAFLMYRSATAPDTQCTTVHKTASTPPSRLTTAMDYFIQGNYEYDTGNCAKAISDYTISIQLDPNYPQAYNNRAYTYMRMRDYKDALPDLDRAIAINPNYIQALINRGDIHNYYYAIDRQSSIADYQKVISLGATHGTSVCGHYFLAEHNGWNLITILNLPRVALNGCH
jgi:tetratricopeptide (TPR) repeat protein